MRLQNSKKAAIIVAALIGSSHVYAEGQKIDLYGSFIGGLQSKQVAKIDAADAKVSSALQRSGAQGTKAMSHTQLGGGFTSADFGANIAVSDAVKAKFELGTYLATSNTDDHPHVKKYYVDADTGSGHVMVGRQDRLFSSVASSVEQNFMSDLTFSGSNGIPYRSMGFVYHTGDMIEGTVVSLGLFNPLSGTAAAKDLGGNPDSTVELSLASQFGMFGANLGLLSEKRTLSVTDATTNVTTVDGSASAMAYSLSLNASVNMIDAGLVVTGGDAIADNTVKGAKMSKDANDTMMAVAVHVGTDMEGLKLGLYVGQETLTHVKKNGAIDKDGKNTDVADVGMTGALSLGYECHGATWLLEFANTKRTFDGVVVGDTSVVSLGASAEFSS